MASRLRAEVQRLRNTLGWSLEGWVSAWSGEKSLRQWTAANAVSVVLSFVVPMTGGERALVVALGLLVLAAELMNTALEQVVDHLSPGRDPRAKRAKDCASAAVGMTALAAGAAWIFVLIG